MELAAAIALISSSADPKTFGTGFVVHQDEEFSYLVTCAHVVRAVENANQKNGEAGRLLVNNLAATVIAQGEPDAIDLAVLCVPRLWDRQPLRLRAAGMAGAAIRLAGQCERESKSAKVAEWLEGCLEKEIALTSPGATVGGWRLRFAEEDRVQAGYSGGPVFCGDAVAAVAAIQLDKAGEQAIAISIDALSKIWPGMPPGLIERPTRTGGEPQRKRRLIGREALPPVPVWQGRDALLADLRRELEPGGTRRLLALLGQGGMGKSALAAKLVAAAGVDLSTGELAADCRFARVVAFKAFEGSSFDDVAAHLLGALGVRGAEYLREAREKAGAIVEALAEETALIVLDNLEVILQPPKHPQAGRAVSPEWGLLLSQLANGNHRSLVLLTSREQPADLGDERLQAVQPNRKRVRLVLVEEVDEASAVAILREYGMQDAEEDLGWLAARVQGHPLYLELLAAEYAERPGYLRRHPEELAGGLDELLQKQVARQSEAARDLLRRMCLLRVPIDTRGLTFLRLYHQDKKRFRRVLPGQLINFKLDELAITKKILQELSCSSLIQQVYDSEACDDLFSLHRVIAVFWLFGT